MAGQKVPVKSVKKVGSLLSELLEIEHRVSERAHELFREYGCQAGRECEYWLQAEKELLWRPCAELVETDGELRASFALAGLTAKHVKVLVEPNHLTVRAATTHEDRKEEGTCHFCEFHRGELYRSMALPSPVIPEKAQAEMNEGMLTVVLPKGNGVAVKKIPIKRAAAKARG
ncbi:heat shock protein Hsp20 [Candidatus Methylomirabilis lanthanidiphila]|uniref:Heat shock protein Hsp20 n=1 Tax=Candidatus Methylomirabilis lanthanidiphila TaxID=2211376 RepID=A0A564ZKG0_9BACT|nr:Hsp20 family protein [Candidatus Methylomirabilis lanthanidiphila]VUZ85811.1 heat shock protein Hsp20 [Candidatus Methylomirabilis lanthanidiphila]